MADPPTNPTRRNHWPIALAPLTAVVRPVATCRRTADAPLWAAWLVHLAGVAAVIAIVAACIAALSHDHLNPALFRAEFARLLFEELPRTVQDPGGRATWLALLATVEAAWLAGAWLLLAWAAQPEPFYRSLSRALRRLWILTPHLALLAGVYGLLLIVQAHAMPSAHAALSPWYLREEALILALMLLAWWWQVVTLWATLPTGWPAHCRWPPLCETCGYGLLATARDGHCPECGTAVAASLDGGPRQPPRAWLPSLRLALRSPRAAGRTLSLFSPGGGERRLVALSALAAAAVSVIAMLALWACSVVAPGPGVFFFDGAEATLATSLTGVGTALCATTAVLALASLAGSLQPGVHRQNMYPAAIRAACLLSPAVPVVVAAAWAWGFAATIVAELDPHHAIGLALGFYSTFELIPFSLLALLGLAGLLLLILATRATTAARYANH